MSSACLETESSSSERRLYIQVSYSVFYMHQCKLSYRTHSYTYKTAYTDAYKTPYT